MLVDSSACVAVPILISYRALNYLYPGVRLSPPPVNNPFLHVNVTNGSSMSILGGLNVLFWFSGKSVKAKSCKGPIIYYWYSACAAIFAN